MKQKVNKPPPPPLKKAKSNAKENCGKANIDAFHVKTRILPTLQQEHLQDVCIRISKNLASFSFGERSSKFWPGVLESKRAQKLQNYLKSRSSLLATCDNPCGFEKPSLILCCTQYRGFV